MKKPVIGLLLGAVLGAFDGLTAYRRRKLLLKSSGS